MVTDIRARLLARVEGVGGDGCWLWTGAKVGLGYGRIRIAGKSRSTHRISYEAFVGPIPDGLVLDHLCRTPACLRPDHLEPVPQRENLRRGNTHWGLIEATGKCRRGHPFEAHAITSGKWRTCGICRTESEARRVRNRAGSTVCPKGHTKVARTNGKLYCPPCFSEACRKRKVSA